MKIKGWSSERYQREYDILRNKTRNYEHLTGKEKGSIKVNELLYTTTKAQKRYGTAYRPSAQVQAINALTSTGTAVFRERGASARVISTQEALLKSQFGGFTSKSTEGREIVELYDLNASGILSTTEKNLTREINDIEKSIDKLINTKGFDKSEKLKQEAEELKKEAKSLKETLSETRDLIERAPKNLAELRRQLDSAAKSLREFKKTKAGEWKEKNPDAPASYAVGTP
jgi:molecular chaperone DnaK (HSP70)